jgi:hypothetical protein
MGVQAAASHLRGMSTIRGGRRTVHGLRVRDEDKTLDKIGEMPGGTMGESTMIYTKADINAAIDKTRVERFRLLCWRHPDPRIRAGYQALVLKNAAGMTGNLTPTEEELRATPAGQRFPADELLIPRSRCGAGGCKLSGPIEFLTEDAE